MNTLTMVTIAVIAILITGLIIPLRMSVRSKIILSLLVIAGMCRNFIYLVVGGSAFDPNIPYNLYFILEMSRSILITLAALVVLRVIINLIYKAVTLNIRAFAIPACSLFYVMIFVGIATAVSIYGTACTYRKPDLAHYQIKLDKLPAELNKMRVVVLSDMHISSQSDPAYVAELVARVNRMNPDLILLPGDLIDGQVNKRHALAKLYFDLRAKFGVYFASGNHEYYSDYTSWQNYLTQGGLISLDNKVAHIRDENGTLLMTLGGVTDPKAANYNLPMPDVAGVQAMLSAKVPNIILSHRPTYARDFSQGKIHADLVVSGHTHGGLITHAAPIVSALNDGFIAGLYKLGPTSLVVSRGINVWQGYPMRLGVPNEIVLIELLSSKQVTKDTVLITKVADKIREQKAKAQALEALEQDSHQQAIQQLQQSAASRKAAAARANAAKAANAMDETNTTASSTSKQDSTRGQSDAYAESVMDSSIMRADGAATDLQIILPMVNIESGEVSRRLTDLAVLPEKLTDDQKSRIVAILEEGTAIARQREAAEAKAKYDQLLEDKINTLPMGYTLDVRESKNANLLPKSPEAKAAAAKAAAAAQAAKAAKAREQKPASGITISSGRNNTAQSAEDILASDSSIPEETVMTSNLQSKVITDDETLYKLETESMSDVNDIAAEYGISLGNSNINKVDHGVNDLIKQQKVQRHFSVPSDEQRQTSQAPN